MHRKVLVVGAILALGMTAAAPCNAQTANTPVQLAQALTQDAFIGSWTGKSSAGKPLGLVVTKSSIVYTFDGKQVSVGAPTFAGNSMTLPVTSGGTVTLTRGTPGQLGWVYQGPASGGHPSISTLQQVAPAR